MEVNLFVPPEIIYIICENNFINSFSINTLRRVCRTWDFIFKYTCTKRKKNEHERLKNSIWAKPFYPENVLLKIKEQEMNEKAYYIYENGNVDSIGFIIHLSDSKCWSVRVYLDGTLWDKIDLNKKNFIQKYLKENHSGKIPNKRMGIDYHSIGFSNKEFTGKKEYVTKDIAEYQVKFIRHLAKTIPIPSL